MSTTDSSCTAVTAVLFDEDQDVHLTGGSTLSGSAVLPDGKYHVVVASPDGTVLGTSGGNAVVTVSNGQFEECLRLVDVVTSVATGEPGFDETNDPAGRYRVGISLNPVFIIPESISTVFNLRSSGATDAELSVVKFYDANTNGVADSGEVLISGWLMRLVAEPDGFSDEAFTTWRLSVTPGSYSVMELIPDQANWRTTTPTPIGIAVAEGQDASIAVGNVCLGPGGGENTAFWTDRDGAAVITPVQLRQLSERNLVNGDGSPFDLTTYQQLRAWMLQPTPSNSANLLSISLATMVLNVSTGKMDQTARVHAPSVATANPFDFITVADLMMEADAALASAINTTIGATKRENLEAIRSPVERANNNLDVVQSTPCPLSFGQGVGSPDQGSITTQPRR